MFEDILFEKNMSIYQLSAESGVGYNYVFKIVKNQTDFSRCGIETAKKIADALAMDLNHIYAYKELYFQRKIYYQDQTNWDCYMFGELNAELNKIFIVGIDYHFAKDSVSRDIEVCKKYDMEISCIRYDKLSENTKCIMVAILNQQKKLREFISVYGNLKELLKQKPLSKKLFLSEKPFNLFQAYKAMNIEY
ncbi:hypothetical protein SAMN04487934_1239 [Eubacterium ruminantium]|nr:hypothetical protein SAMN04487934_1239 [Eubacterium ruminantium]